MRVRPGFGETLPALLRRSRGVPERVTVGAAVAVVVLAVAFLALRDPLDGKAQRIHRGTPVFNTLYREELVRPALPRGDELQRYEARRGGVALRVTVRPVRLPAYRGDVAGVLPVLLERHADLLEAELPRFRILSEGRARINTAPGYEIAYRYGTGERRSSGQDVVVVAPDEPGSRDGVLISLRQEATGPYRRRAARPAIRAMKSVFRSFKYGDDRDD